MMIFKNLHERTQIFIGNEEDVKMVESSIKKEEVSNDIYMSNKSYIAFN